MGYGGGYGGGYGPDGVESFGAVAFTGTGTFGAAGGTPIYALVAFEGTGSFLPIARFTGTDYSLIVVDKEGAIFGAVEDARIGSVTFELNGAGGLDFSLATTDTDNALCVPGREVQLYRGNQLLFWGPIVRQQIGLDEATYQCAGLLWYFERRFMGKADRTNLLVNGDFEDSETGWTFEEGVTHSIDFATKLEGAKSLKLEGSTADHIEHAEQVYTHSPQYHPDGDSVVVSAWVRIPSADYLGGANSDLGLVAIHKRAGVVIADPYIEEIGDDTTKDYWLHLEVAVPGVKDGDTIEVQLYPPHGTAYWDDVSVTLFESLSFWPGTDVAAIVAGIVDYAQDNGAFTHGKSDLNIGTSWSPTNITKDLTYQFAEHRNIADAIREHVEAGYLDIDIPVTPTTRTFTVYHPRKGAYRADLPLTLDTTVADFSYAWDGEAAASSVIVLGPGDGPDRPEGGATDPTFLSGLTLEWVDSAPDDVTVGDLDVRAAERLRVATNPTVIEVTTLPGVNYIGQLQTGDTVPVNIAWGPLAINTTYRAVTIAVDPHTDQATVTLNAEV